MIAITSRQAYDKIKASLPAKRKAVLVAAEKGTEWCINSLAYKMNLPPNHISGRTGELRSLGLLVDTEIRKLNGYNCQYFRAARPERLF